MPQQTMTEPPPRIKKTSSAATYGVVGAGLLLIVGLVVALIFSTPNPEAKPRTIGFSLNKFFQWLGDMNPLVQIPIIVLVFAAVVGLILLLIEYAPRRGPIYFWIRLIASFAIPFIAFMLLRPYSNALLYVIGISLLIGGVMFFADLRARQGAGYLFQLTLFMAPAAIFLAVGLVYPAISTIIKSFYNKAGDEFIGLDNYHWVLTNPEGTWSIINTLIWALIAPAVSTIIGLAYAVFIDRARGEKILKVLVFMPVAISFVGAGIIWKFMYDVREGQQIGLLNAVVTTFGGSPVSWLDAKPIWNTLFLLIVFIWTQTGFAMVILSAAIKAVPTEQLEAASLDGATAWQRFRNVTVPGIRGSLIVVLTTVTIASLKVYDIVAVMTGGRSDTTVLGFEMVNQQQRFQSFGHSSALAVVLFLFVMPLIIFNARQMTKQREIR